MMPVNYNIKANKVLNESEHQSWHASAKNKRYAKKLSNKGARGMPGSVQWLRSICNDKPRDNYRLS